jgi:hypothetical protein
MALKYRYRVSLILAWLLLFVGWMCSFGVWYSCRFVYATIDNSVGDLPETLKSYLPTGSRRGLGFFTWELKNGKCSNTLGDKLTETLAETLVDSYTDFLGRDWRAPRGFGTTAVFLSYFSYIFLLCHTILGKKLSRNMRYIFSAFCLVILVVFQSVTFAVITSDFCDKTDCELSQGARLSIAAVLCFFFSGLLFLVMGDPPGDEDAEAAAAAATGKGAYEEASLADTEEPTVEHVEDDQPTEQVEMTGF